MKYRIIKKTFEERKVYVIQKRYPFIPFWFDHVEDLGTHSQTSAYYDVEYVHEKYQELIAERDYAPESLKQEVVVSE